MGVDYPLLPQRQRDVTVSGLPQWVTTHLFQVVFILPPLWSFSKDCVDGPSIAKSTGKFQGVSFY
jgi:hypothetical protein